MYTVKFSRQTPSFLKSYLNSSLG